MFSFKLLMLCTVTPFVGCKTNFCHKVGDAISNVEEALAILQEAKSTLSNVSCENAPLHRVGFYVKMMSDVTLAPSQTVIFDHVITNSGGNYNPQTGHFTAPFGGMYYFSSSFMKTPTSNCLHLHIMKNDDEVSRGYAAQGNDYLTGYMSAVIFLKKGDVVRIQHFTQVPAQTIHSNSFSFFNGYLIN